MQLRCTIKQPSRKRLFTEVWWCLVNVFMRIDQGGRDGAGVHGLKWIGHDGVQAFAV